MGVADKNAYFLQQSWPPRSQTRQATTVVFHDQVWWCLAALKYNAFPILVIEGHRQADAISLSNCK